MKISMVWEKDMPRFDKDTLEREAALWVIAALDGHEAEGDICLTVGDKGVILTKGGRNFLLQLDVTLEQELPTGEKGPLCGTSYE